jgi:hypothetical protein
MLVTPEPFRLRMSAFLADRGLLEEQPPTEM